jgi:hypothetical protein
VKKKKVGRPKKKKRGGNKPPRKVGRPKKPTYSPVDPPRKPGRPRKEVVVRTPRKVGRPRRCLPYEASREIVRSEMIKSRVEYIRWWMDNRPSVIPKSPDRAYKKEWRGWGDYLGHSNPFPFARRKFRSYRDSRAWAHNTGCKTRAEWLLYCKRPDFPVDVPKRPDIYYNKTLEWMTWKEFLGRSVSDKVAALGESENIIYVIQYPELPSNVYTIGITNEGKAGLIARRDQFGFNILAGYHHDNTPGWIDCIEDYIRKYHIGNNNYICNNINDVLSTLSLRYHVVR